MNVIILTTVKMLSGGTRQAVYLASALKARGHNVHFVLPKDKEVQDLVEEAGIQWSYLPDGLFAVNRHLRSLMSDGKPTVVHAFHNKGVKLAAYLGTLWRLMRLPVVCVAHRGVVTRPGNPLPYLLPGIRAFLVNSQACADALPLLWRRRRCHVVNNSIPTERITPERTAEEVRNELQIPENHFIIGDVASSQPRKAVDRLLMAYAKARNDLPPSTLVLVGVDDRMAPLCRSLGLSEHVRLVPYAKSVSDYLQLFDLFVFPPYVVESQPNVVLEAMLMNVPVIASRIGGVPEILPERCLFKAGDVDEMSRKMIETVNSPELLQSMREENAATSHLFTVEHRVETLLAHYSRILSEDVRPGGGQPRQGHTPDPLEKKAV